MTWTDPPDWAALDTVTESDMDTYITGNLQYLYDNLPTRCTMFHSESVVTAGNALAGSIITGNAHNAVWNQCVAANSDAFTHAFVLAEGLYGLYWYGLTGPNCGYITWAIDGTTIATNQDWYSAGWVYNVTLGVAITISTGGRHVLTGTVTGKNAGSSGYYISLTKMYVLPGSD